MSTSRYGPLPKVGFKLRIYTAIDGLRFRLSTARNSPILPREYGSTTTNFLVRDGSLYMKLSYKLVTYFNAFLPFHGDMTTLGLKAGVT